VTGSMSMKNTRMYIRVFLFLS